MNAWRVKRVEHTTSGYPNNNRELDELLADGWEPFAARHSDRIHHHTASWVWVRKQETADRVEAPEGEWPNMTEPGKRSS